MSVVKDIMGNNHFSRTKLLPPKDVNPDLYPHINLSNYHGFAPSIVVCVISVYTKEIKLGYSFGGRDFIQAIPLGSIQQWKQNFLEATLVISM